MQLEVLFPSDSFAAGCRLVLRLAIIDFIRWRFCRYAFRFFPSILMPLSDEVIFGVSGLWITSVPLAALLPFSVAEISAPLIASLPFGYITGLCRFYYVSSFIFTAEVPSDISVILVPSATLLIALAPSATFPHF